MLATRYKPLLNRTLEPLARAIAGAGVSPTAITVSGVTLATLVCMRLLYARAILPFCLAILLVGLLDGVDGAVARVSGRETKFGAYLDAMADRYTESIVVFCVAYVSGYWALSMAVLAGALLVSYAKARAAMEVPVSNLEWPDLMERAERGLLFIGGLALGAICPWRPLGHDLFWWTLLLLAILIHATVLQRILRAHRLIRTRA